MIDVEIKVVHDSHEFVGEIMEITSGDLGYEDHEMFAVNIAMRTDSVSQGTGFIGLALGGQGTAYGMDLLIRIIDVVGCRRWNNLKGRSVIALRDKPGDFVRGIADLTGKRVLIFKEHAEGWATTAEVHPGARRYIDGSTT